MVEHDFYKLMQIPLYSAFSEVKKRYYELALIYHPDKNPNNKDAEEYFKIVTQGYNLLGDVDKKSQYDLLLRNYYNTQDSDKTRVQTPKRDMAERLFQIRENKRQDIITDYLNTENTFSHKNRLWAAILLSVSGFLMTYNHWFINYTSLDIIYNFGGFLITYFGVYLIANNVYRRDSYRNAIKLVEDKSDRKAIRLFLTLFFSLPFIFWTIVQTSAAIQLHYFADYTTVENITVQSEVIYYEYTVNDEKIVRSMTPEFDEKLITPHNTRVKFSRINPNISEIILINP